MSVCPHCHQPIDAKAIRCPYCATELKAYGHPGIPLHQAEGETFLCDRCLYDEDDTCTYPQRPYAKTCMLFYDKSQPLKGDLADFSYRSSLSNQVKNWLQRNRGLVLLLILIAISLMIALR